jgi:hypothetical protein
VQTAEVLNRIRAGYPDFFLPTSTFWSRPRIAEPTGMESAARELWDSNKLLREIWGDGTWARQCDKERREGGRAQDLLCLWSRGVCQLPFATENSRYSSQKAISIRCCLGSDKMAFEGHCL